MTYNTTLYCIVSVVLGLVTSIMYCSGLLPVASAIAAILGPAPSASSAAGGLVASGAGVAEESLDSGTGGAAMSAIGRRALMLQMAQ
jgi:hypothetical protein